MKRSRDEISRDELKRAIIGKVTSGGRWKFFKYVWTLTTLLSCLLMNVLLRRELIASSRGTAGYFPVICGEACMLLVSACAGFFYARVLWLHFTRWYPERHGNRR
jgi:hypothetical protein